MASIDPRKKESITNQPNYLLTVVTTLLGAFLFAAYNAGSIDVALAIVFAIFWIIAFGSKQVEKVVNHYFGKDEASSGSPPKPDIPP
ncbi:unnamed protein product [marine sediment metagenome]|uniref:Uncharacterized protein n=1 Tax=marine sediment metagenome TaxID=412755 RepID=X1A9L9_9ZZZZ